MLDDGEGLGCLHCGQREEPSSAELFLDRLADRILEQIHREELRAVAKVAHPERQRWDARTA